MRRIQLLILTLFVALSSAAQTSYTPWGWHARKGQLKDPENLKTDVWYDEQTGTYRMGTKLGEEWTEVPYFLSSDEYQNWAIRQSMNDYYAKKNQEEFQNAEKNQFDFTDMQFNIGKASKIFGPGGVRIKTTGSAELKLGGNHRFTDNPSLSERNRKVFGFDFDEKINLSLNGKVGDKINMDFAYNSEATFNMDAQNLKLRYEGKEDEILKLVEVGNVSMPTNSSLIRGAQSLFGAHVDLQFGKLRLGVVMSQKNSASASVSSKGGVQVSPFEFSADEYSENRHFWLGHFFRQNYDTWMEQIPNILSGITINRIEVWVTNKNGTTTNTRNLVALPDLGESTKFDHNKWNATGLPVPANSANDSYDLVVQALGPNRNVSQISVLLDGQGLVGGSDYEKLESARLLSSNEYILNQSLGTISLRSALQTDQVLAVAFEYTYRGQTYQVGEFSTDMKDNTQSLIVKSLKNTANTPQMNNWDLMMKNVYYLGGTSVQKDQFKLDVKILSDTTGVYLSYLPEPGFKDRKLIQLIGMDRLDNNQKHNPNGTFDFVPGLTINTNDGMAYFTTAEPFGSALRKAIGNDAIADRYCFQELYDSTRTIAKQIAEHNKFTISGQFKATKNDEINLGVGNIPSGSVVVTAGGVTLTEGSDYTVDYNSGIVKILNKSILDAGTNISCSVESNTNYGLQRKTMMGLTFQYDFSKDFSLGGTLMHLYEKPLTTKVSMGTEPLNNTIWGLNLSWKKESQRLTDWLNKVPFLHLKSASSINLTGEFAQLIAGKSKEAQGNASYIDDFENTKSEINISNPQEWVISSVPAYFKQDAAYLNDVRGGYNRARLAWYYIDPLFTRKSSALTPPHIKADVDQLSDWDVREVYRSELFPNKSINYKESNTLSVLNMAFYPTERGPYNLDPVLNANGSLPEPRQRWGGMMRKLDTSDFETANIEYIEFWMMDPFMKERQAGGTMPEGGDLYFNLGEVSEDILRDGKKFYESGMPTDGSLAQVTETAWGRVPAQQSVTYAFNTASGSRSRQDVGYNGLSSEEERSFGAYQQYLEQVKPRVSADAYANIYESPSADRYHYFRGGDYDNRQLSILDRYKLINNPNGNSVAAEESPESYSTAYKTTPDVEDINQDYTLNEYEKYYQYRVSIRPQDMQVGLNHIVDKRTTITKTRNGEQQTTDWYQFRIPVSQWESKMGSIADFSSIRFMRMFLTGFDRPEVLRFATLNLVRGEWRPYEQSLYVGQAPDQSGTLAVSAVNFEENNTKLPVNYVLPPGISRETIPGQDQVLQNDEQSLALTVENLASGDARAVYRNTSLDLRNYKHLQMFVHANALMGDDQLQDGQMSLFLRMGSDYKNNYYEYEVPLTLTPEGNYASGQAATVWPSDNMIDIDFSLLTGVKRNRNRNRGLGLISYAEAYSEYDASRPNNKVTVQGNPSLGEVRTIMIGVRNKSREVRSIEVWANELRLQDFANSGGWAAQAQLNLKLSDLGSVNLSGHMETYGFGGLEETVSQRRDDNLYQYSVTTNVEAGKVLPEAVKLNAPVYYSYSRQRNQPHYNPLDSDMTMDEAYDGCATEHERDSLKNIVETVVVNKNFSMTGIRFNHSTKRAHMPYDPANFTFGYAHSEKHTTGETTAWEKDNTWKWNASYQYATNFKPIEPWKKMKTKSKWAQWLKEFGLNYFPQSLGATADINRRYYELQERDMDALMNGTATGSGYGSPLTWSSDFLFNRTFQLRWDLTKALKLSFQSGTNAEIEQPYTAINKDLYPDQHQAWKDSIWESIRELGKPLTYSQQAEASWTLPLTKLPVFDWITSDVKYTSTYNWARGTELTSGAMMGHTISTQRNINANGKLNLETLYNHWNFLKDVNKKFAGTAKKRTVPPSRAGKAGASAADKDNDKKKKFEKEITLRSDSTQTLQHNQKTKKLRVMAIRQDGSRFPVRFKVLDANKIELLTLDTVKLKITVEPKAIKEDQTWFKVAQGTARVLMMLRNVSVSYRNTYNLSVPGFMPSVGDILGQSRGGGSYRPGLDFAFGAVSDSYVNRAAERGWLMMSDSILTPAASSRQEDISGKATLEPLRDVKIDVNFNRNTNTSRSMQYMYAGCPTMETGSFTQTMISIKSAFRGIGNADNGYRNATFDKFLGLLDTYQQQVQQKYEGVRYPAGTTLAGQTYNPENGTVDKYGAEVMVPAFLKAYSSGSDGLRIFPTIKKILPSWTFTYAGLAKLNRMKRVFKSFNLTHGYKSTYSVGSFNTFTSYMDLMDGYGFVTNVTTGLPTPSSRYDISTITINESFAPLIGLDMTFKNSLSMKVEYRKTRVLNLSLTSQQLTENHTNDWVVGAGYKIADFNPFQSKTKVKKAKGSRAKGTGDDEEDSSTSRRSNSRSTSSGFAHSLNLRFDLTLRSQAAIQRNILTGLSQATSGNSAFNISCQAEYAVSRMLTMSAFYNLQKNTPLLTSSSYPTITQDFGFNIKFTLTR
ncbi:MAG: cell surface protein SprA [Bacteroidaceae bacterium]|nr:cell surface protein SprA [Bacteroidaceae bacterium]